jgi:hypothetical protein
MQKAPSWAGPLFVSLFCLTGQAMAEGQPQATGSSAMTTEAEREVIVQLGGRYCEYHRKDVENAIRRHSGVRRVEFLNDHGTVLVGYEDGMVQPAQLAEAAAGAAFGTGCKAWVDRG